MREIIGSTNKTNNTTRAYNIIEDKLGKNYTHILDYAIRMERNYEQIKNKYPIPRPYYPKGLELQKLTEEEKKFLLEFLPSQAKKEIQKEQRLSALKTRKASGGKRTRKHKKRTTRRRFTRRY